LLAEAWEFLFHVSNIVDAVGYAYSPCVLDVVVNGKVLIIEVLELGVVVGGNVLIIEDVLEVVDVLIIDVVLESNFVVLVFVFSVEVGKLSGVEKGSMLAVLCVGKFVGIENGSPRLADRVMTIICGRHRAIVGNSVAIGRR